MFSVSMRVNRNIEKTTSAWFWRFLLGPSMILDGIVFTVSLSTLTTGAALAVSRNLAMARIKGMYES